MLTIDDHTKDPHNLTTKKYVCSYGIMKILIIVCTERMIYRGQRILTTILQFRLVELIS